MAAKSPRRRQLASDIAVIARQDPADPRLPELRRQLDALGVSEIHAWAHQAAADLPALSPGEIQAIGRAAARIDARVKALVLRPGGGSG
jgi:hypothetical protein